MADGGKRRGPKLQEILFLAMIGVVYSIIYMAVLNIGMALTAILTPMGLGVFRFEIVYGIWFMAATTAATIIQRPGVAFLAEFLASVIELLLGNPGGMLVVITGLIQSTGAEIGYATLRYREWNLKAACVSALCCALITMLQTLYIGGYAGLSIGIILAMLFVRIASSLFFAGFLSYKLVESIAKTGVLRSYPIGKRKHIS